MITEANILTEFNRLWDVVPQSWQMACNLVSPNEEDSDILKMAMIGFSCHDKMENWKQGHFKIAQCYLKECDSLGDSEDMKKINMLLLGALLGMYSAGKIDDGLYRTGYILLPGFVMGRARGAIK